MIYVTMKDNKIVLRCDEHPKFSHSFPPGTVMPVNWLTAETNEHIRIDHIALPARIC